MAAKRGWSALFCAMFAASVSPSVLWAAAPPPPPAGTDAGSVMRDIGDTTPSSDVTIPEISVPVHKSVQLPEGVTVSVKGFSFTGNTVFDEAQLQSLLAGAVGRDMSLAELVKQVEAVTRYYRQAGYLVARAYLPAQEIKDGMITVGVLEGNVGEVALEGDISLPDWIRDGYLKPVKDSKVLQVDSLERSLLLINDLAGISANAALRPGAAPGSTDVGVQLTPTKLVTGSIDFNNYGSNYNGNYRLGGLLNINNGLGYGEQFTLRPVISEDLDTLYGQVGVQFPVGGYGTKMGLGYTHVKSDIGREFAALGLQGKSQVFSVYLTHPIIRSRHTNLFGSLRFDLKNVTDHYDSQLDIADNKDYLRIVTAGLSGDIRDSYYGGGNSTYSVSAAIGLKNLTATATDPLADGKFIKLNFDVSRLQRLGSFDSNLQHTALFLRLSGQFARDRLVSSEQISLGGPRGVRAFAPGEAQGDSAVIMTAEVRQDLQAYKSENWDVVQGYVGMDFGRSNRNDPLPGEPDGATRSGVALGLKFGKSRDYLVDVSVATRLFGDGATANGDQSQVWLQGVKWFE